MRRNYWTRSSRCSSKNNANLTSRIYNDKYKLGFSFDASVAQLVEQRFRKARVEGSSPFAGFSYFSPFCSVSREQPLTDSFPERYNRQADINLIKSTIVSDDGKTFRWTSLLLVSTQLVGQLKKTV